MQSSSDFQEKIMHQFDYICKKAMKGEMINYKRHKSHLMKHEVLMPDVSTADIYTTHNNLELEILFEEHIFTVFEFKVSIQDEGIANAIKKLSSRKRTIILLSYFCGMKDIEIAELMNVKRNTICEHRNQSLKQMRKFMG